MATNETSTKIMTSRTGLPFARVATSVEARVSGRRTMPMARFTSDSAAATKYGTDVPATTEIAPITGPMTKPSPNAAPSSPMSLGRSLGSATSAATARATPTDAPDAPSTTRPTNSQAIEPARPRTRLPIIEPAMVTSNTGRRPTLSETLPQMGENTNWAREYEAKRAPITAGEASKDSA